MVIKTEAPTSLHRHRRLHLSTDRRTRITLLEQALAEELRGDIHERNALVSQAAFGGGPDAGVVFRFFDTPPHHAQSPADRLQQILELLHRSEC